MTEEQLKKMDILLIGGLAGIFAKIVQSIIGYLAILIYPPYMNCIRIAAGLKLTEEQVMAGGLWPILVGIQIDFVVGIVVAVVAVLILQKWGFDYYIYKGAIIGLASWALFYVVLSQFLSRIYPVGSVPETQISFLSHIAYGVAITWSVVWLVNWFDKQEKKRI